ncbi:ABC transporter permease [Amycolatopsis sp.]|uniref:ABC transporter permease n=1 Tax=Amycolatopsis sp. TaxID=37632 RepID=UPI002DFE5562|nr:ABC transporter permease [Amycolatopsis sp.]
MPWRAAPRAALSSPLTMVVATVTALLACFLGTAAVLQASAAGGATAQYQAALDCPDNYGPTFSKTRVDVASAPAAIATVRRQAAAHGFSTPVVGAYTPILGTEFAGTNGLYKTVLAYRGTQTLDRLQLIQGTRAPGIWVGDVVSGAEHIGVGSTASWSGIPSPPVTGVYRELSTPPPRWWCSQQSTAVVNRLVNDPLDSVLFATDQKTFDDTVSALKVRTYQYLHISFYETPPRTLSEAKQLVDRGKAMVADVEADLRAQGLGGVLVSQVPFDRSTQIATQAQSNVAVSILPLAAISVLVGCASIATVALQWYQRRFAQLRLLSSRGSGPGALGGLAIAELGLPIVAGGAAGTVLARTLLGVYGPPGGVDETAVLLSIGVAALILLFSLGLIVLVVRSRAHRDFELGRIRRKTNALRLLGAFPWELVTAGLAFLGWSRMIEYGAASKLGKPLPQIDPVALTYPVCVVLTAGLLAARVAWLLLYASHRARFWSRPALQLAIRRLASARAPVTGVLVISTLAIGTLAAGIGIGNGQENALREKSGIFVGANTRVDTESGVGFGEPPLPAELAATSSLVGTTTGTGSVVMVVDPATFTTAAELGRLDRDTVSELLRRIDTRTGAGIPAIRIAPNAKQTLRLPGLPDAAPIADLPLFPMIGTNPGYVVSRNALTPQEIRELPRWTVLSSSPADVVSGALAKANLLAVDRVSQDTALDALPFYVVSWTFSFVALLGAVLGVVAILALLVAVEVRRRQNALAGALVLRMGMRPRALLGSHLIELGALAGMAVLAGVVCGVSVAGLAVPRFDPATFLAPRAALPDPTLFITGVVGVGVLVVLLAGGIAVRSVRTARTAELIRA